MWPQTLDWKQLRFGVGIEFVGGRPEEVELLPGWTMALDERQLDEAGEQSGSELQSPPMRWDDREHIREMLRRLQAQHAAANWSCGLHVHVGLEPWGLPIVLPLLQAAVARQDALRQLLRTSEHRMLYCPPVTEDMITRYTIAPGRSALRHLGRPQSHRCGVNAAAWYDIGTAEIRYANGTLDADEVLRTVELCLRFIAAVGEGRSMPDGPAELAAAIGAPADGYPPPLAPPLWYRERRQLEDALIPILAPEVDKLVSGGEILDIRPAPEGLIVTVEQPGGKLTKFDCSLPANGWTLKLRN